VLDNGTNGVEAGNPAAQQAAHTDAQQAPTQLRSESDEAGPPVWFRWACCNTAVDFDGDDASKAALPSSPWAWTMTWCR